MPGEMMQSYSQNVLPLASHIPFLERWYTAHPHPALFWKNQADQGRTSQPELAHIRDQLRQEFPMYHVSIASVKEAIMSKDEWKSWFGELEAMMNQAGAGGGRSSFHISMINSGKKKKKVGGGLGPHRKTNFIPASSSPTLTSTSTLTSSTSSAAAIPIPTSQGVIGVDTRRTQSVSIVSGGPSNSHQQWKLPPTRPRAMTYNGQNSSTRWSKPRDRPHPYGNAGKRPPTGFGPFAGSVGFQRAGFGSGFRGGPQQSYSGHQVAAAPHCAGCCACSHGRK